MSKHYSVACENDDIREDLKLRDAKKVAMTLHSLGRQYVVINVQDDNYDLISIWKFVGNKLEYSGQ